MNDLLRDTLTERADGAEPPALDLDAIVAAGDRHITRRRFGSVLGGAAVTLGAIAGGVAVARSVDRRPAPAPAKVPGFVERRATYALGSEIHYGNDVISVAPHKINAFVQTDAGFVFLNHENAIHIADKSGVRALGKSTWRLTADNHGSMVAWVEDFNGHSESVVYDVANNRELARTAIGNKHDPLASYVMGPRIAALDGETAYFGTLHGLYRWDLRAGSGRKIADGLPNMVRAASSSNVLYPDPAEHVLKGTRLLVGPTPGEPTGRAFPGRQGYLSPTSDYVLTGPTDNPYGEPEAAVFGLYSVKTGAKLPLRHPDHSRLIFSQWLDDTTFTAVGVRRGTNPPVDLLTCSATALTCKVSAAAFSTYTFSKTGPRTTAFAVPLGTPIIWYFS